MCGGCDRRSCINRGTKPHHLPVFIFLFSENGNIFSSAGFWSFFNQYSYQIWSLCAPQAKIFSILFRKNDFPFIFDTLSKNFTENSENDVSLKRKYLKILLLKKKRKKETLSSTITQTREQKCDKCCKTAKNLDPEPAKPRTPSNEKCSKLRLFCFSKKVWSGTPQASDSEDKYVDYSIQ